MLRANKIHRKRAFPLPALCRPELEPRQSADLLVGVFWPKITHCLYKLRPEFVRWVLFALWQNTASVTATVPSLARVVLNETVRRWKEGPGQVCCPSTAKDTEILRGFCTVII